MKRTPPPPPTRKGQTAPPPPPRSPLPKVPPFTENQEQQMPAQTEKQPQKTSEIKETITSVAQQSTSLEATKNTEQTNVEQPASQQNVQQHMQQEITQSNPISNENQSSPTFPSARPPPSRGAPPQPKKSTAPSRGRAIPPPIKAKVQEPPQTVTAEQSQNQKDNINISEQSKIQQISKQQPQIVTNPTINQNNPNHSECSTVKDQSKQGSKHTPVPASKEIQKTKMQPPAIKGQNSKLPPQQQLESQPTENYTQPASLPLSTPEKPQGHPFLETSKSHQAQSSSEGNKIIANPSASSNSKLYQKLQQLRKAKEQMTQQNIEEPQEASSQEQNQSPSFEEPSFTKEQPHEQFQEDRVLQKTEEIFTQQQKLTNTDNTFRKIDYEEKHNVAESSAQSIKQPTQEQTEKVVTIPPVNKVKTSPPSIKNTNRQPHKANHPPPPITMTRPTHQPAPDIISKPVNIESETKQQHLSQKQQNQPFSVQPVATTGPTSQPNSASASSPLVNINLSKTMSPVLTEINLLLQRYHNLKATYLSNIHDLQEQVAFHKHRQEQQAEKITRIIGELTKKNQKIKELCMLKSQVLEPLHSEEEPERPDQTAV